MLAVGCYGALDELALRCPEDVSVIGFNDMPFVDRLRPPLSTIRFPHTQVGTEAARLLIERIETGEGSPVKILFLAPELVAEARRSPSSNQARSRSAPPRDDAGSNEDPGATRTRAVNRYL